MSGLETAIRNALEKSDRANPDIRERIYQSARHALDAGLGKQGIGDPQLVAAQRQRLELAIRAIEAEERAALQAARRQMPASAPPVLPAGEAPYREAGPENAGDSHRLPQDAVTLGGNTRDAAPDPVTIPGSSADTSGLGSLRAERMAPSGPAPSPEPAPSGRKAKTPRRQSRGGALLDAPPERAAKPRRRRGFLAVLSAWLAFFALLAAGVWWAYSSGLVQQTMEGMLDASGRAAADRGQGGFDPQVGFSDDWIEIFGGKSAAAAPVPGASASVGQEQTAGGPAFRLSSASPGAEGDIVVEVPPEALREMAGTTSTIALTLQSGSERSVQFSVRCDFASLGTCPRHRFTARQEKEDVLFHVSFDQSLAPNMPGRLILNTGLVGGEDAVLLHSVRVLPGQ